LYQVKYPTAKNTVFSTFGCANYVSTAGGYTTVTKGLSFLPYHLFSPWARNIRYVMLCSHTLYN